MTQVRKNLLTNILCLIVNILVGVLYTPYLVRSLGAAAYGVIPLALLINQYIGILTESLTGAVTRFYSVEYRQENYKAASTYFTSAILFTVMLAVLLMPVIYVLVDNVDRFLAIPVDLLVSAKVLFNLTAASFFCAVASNCINVTIFADNRLDLVNYVKIARNVLKLVINILLFVVVEVDIANVGLSYILAEVVVLLLSVLFYKFTKHSEIKFSLGLFDYKVLQPIFGMILWVSVICFANTFIYKIDSILVTNYFGIYYTGVIASLAEFGSYCISITAVIGALFRPLVLISYSENKHDEVKRMSIGGAHVVGILSCALCGVIIGFSKPLLTIWLTDEFTQYSLWFIIKMSVIPFVTVGGIYSMVFNFWNKVRKPAIISIVIAIANVGISYLLLESGISISLFLIINAVCIVLQGYVMNYYMLVSIYSDLKGEAVKSAVRFTFYYAIVIIASLSLSSLLDCQTIASLLVSCLCMGVAAIALGFLFINKHETSILNMIIPIESIKSKIWKK